MREYFLKNIASINYHISIHEGDANRRLASKAPEILFKLFSNEVPIQHIKEFEKLQNKISITLDNLRGCVIPVRIDGIKNVTAAKYIKLLIDIEYLLRNDHS